MKDFHISSKRFHCYLYRDSSGSCSNTNRSLSSLKGFTPIILPTHRIVWSYPAALRCVGRLSTRLLRLLRE